MDLARLDYWVATVCACLNHTEKRGWYRHKVYAVPYTTLVINVVNKLIRPVFKFM